MADDGDEKGLDQQLVAVTKAIADVEREIRTAEDKEEKRQLREKERQLREKENLLLEKENLLLKQNQPTTAALNVESIVAATLKRSRDPGLSGFTKAPGCKSESATSTVKKLKTEGKTEEAETWGIKCFMCGSKENVAMAHIYPGTEASLRSNPLYTGAWERLQNYHEKFAFDSPRNFIFLCGIESDVNTCHGAFDNFLCCLLPPNPLVLGSSFTLRWFDKKGIDRPDALAVCPKSWKPYRRALCLHARVGLLRYQAILSSTDLDTCITQCDISAPASPGRDDEDDDEAASTTS